MFSSAKFFPIREQIFEFHMFKWPESREEVFGFKEKIFDFYQQNFRCLFITKEKEKKTWYKFSDKNSYILMLLIIIFCLFIHWFLYKKGFYERKEANSDRSSSSPNVVQSSSSGTSEKSKTNTESSNTQNSVSNDHKKKATIDHVKNSQNVKEDNVLVTKITEQKYGYVIAPKNNSRANSILGMGPYYVKVSETNIETSTINKNEKNNSQTNSNPNNNQTPSVEEMT